MKKYCKTMSKEVLKNTGAPMLSVYAGVYDCNGNGLEVFRSVYPCQRRIARGDCPPDRSDVGEETLWPLSHHTDNFIYFPQGIVEILLV